MPRKLLKLIEIRIFIGFFLLLSLIIIQLAFLNLFPIKFFFSFLGLLFTFSLLYLFLLRIGVKESVLIWIQLAGDWTLISFLILFTGGYESLLYFLFVFLLLEAFSFLKDKNSLLIVSLTPLLSYLIFSFTSFYFRIPNSQFNYREFTTGLMVYALGFPSLAYILIISREELKKLTGKLIMKEEEINFASKLDQLLSHTHECVLLVQNGGIVLRGKACENYPVEELIKEKGLVKYRGRLYRITKLPLRYGDIFVISDNTQRWFMMRREGIKDTIAIIAHELRNPLASILGVLQLLPYLEEEKKHEFIEKIKDRAEKINEILIRWGSLGENPSPQRAIGKLKEILSKDGANFQWKIERERIILKRTPPLSEREITMLIQPNLRELPTGKGFAALELAYIIASIGATLTATPSEVRIEWKES